MNEFTKEELKELLNGYQMHSHNTRHNWPSLDLCKKIQSLIDNYKEPCEHEFTRELMQIDLCDKCKSFNFVFAGVNDE